MSQVTLVEVGLRDGLQNESVHLSVEQRLEMLEGLANAGLKRLEVGAFVREDKIPQMAGSKQLLALAQDYKKQKRIPRNAEFSVLIPNLHGWKEAEQVSPHEVAIFASCTESFSQKNINCSIAESFERFKPVVEAAKKKRLKVRGYLSVCFGCPYEGAVPEKQVLAVVKKMIDLKVDEISIGDTIGVANVGQVQSLFKKLKKLVPAKKLAGHFHDTRGQALANILAAYEMGIRTFDTSLGGLGGCPYAPGSSGNVATEDVVYMFNGMKVKTGVDLQKLINLNHNVANWMGKSLPARVSKAGLLKPKNK